MSLRDLILWVLGLALGGAISVSGLQGPQYVLAFVALAASVAAFALCRRYARVGTSIVLSSTVLLALFLAAWLVQPARPFCFIKPAVWINNSTWIFFVTTKGDQPLSNVRITFIDAVAQNASPPDSTRYMTTLKYEELDREDDAAQFFWTPFKADDQQYDVVFRTRGGAFRQMLRVRRVDGHWAYATRVFAIDSAAVLLECRDERFPSDAEWRTALPACFPKFPRK